MAKSQSMPWDDYVSDAYAVELRLSLGASRTKAAPIRLALFRMQYGCRVGWSVGDFPYAHWHGLEELPFTMGRIVVEAMGSLCGHPSHCRLSNLNRNDATPGRVLDFASCSTVVVVGLLLRSVALHRARGD